MPSVYVETSFVSACVSDRNDAGSVYRRDTSLEWWRCHARRYDLATSAEVLQELSDPSFRHSREALDLIRDVDLLDVDSEVTGVAEILVREFLVPGPLAGDAIHVAAAVVHRMDFLLTWNVRHLANPNKLRYLQVVCRRLGLVPPAIVTPDLLWDES
ncbi:MAG: hypothetical protein KIS87_01350 [Phycisphaeraceae bacterium]|nr:hypothetical protein [Phycisphaeraceae bacterium]